MRDVARTVILLLACSIAAPAAAQGVTPDPFPGAPKGRLILTLELTGSGRKDLPNRVEWFRLSAHRKLELELSMVLPAESAGPAVKAADAEKDSSSVPPGMAAIAKLLEACKGDEACQRRTMMAVGQQMMANPQALGSTQLDYSRYENWVADRRGSCAKGTVIVADEGDGVAISPPLPAKPYRFKRTGQLEISSKSMMNLMDAACQAEVTVDRQKGLFSLRVKSLNIPVPVQLSGDVFTTEKSALFLENSRKLELFDQAEDTGAKTWTGHGQFEKAGTASHNAGQTVAPMSGTFTWRFARD
jgi:hypothetical protein